MVMRVRIEGEFEVMQKETYRLDRISDRYAVLIGGIKRWLPAEVCTVIEEPIKKGSMVWAWNGADARCAVVKFYDGVQNGGKGYCTSNSQEDTPIVRKTNYFQHVRLVTADDLEAE